MRRLFSLIALFLALSMLFCACKKTEKPADNDNKQEEEAFDYSQTAVFTANHAFNVSEMAYLFFGAFGDFYRMYGAYFGYLGIDLEKPFKEQACQFEEGVDQSWFDYFLESTKLYAEQFLIITEAAKANGEALSEADKKDIEQSIQDLKDYTAENKIDFQEYLDITYGNGVTEESIRNVLEITFLSSNYYDKIYYGYTYTEDDYSKYIEENLKDETDYNYINVRHILVETEEEAKALLDEILKAEDVKSEFAKKAGEKTLDPGSKNTGGLYNDVYKGKMVQPFNDWCFDEERKPGDTGIVSSTHGYHVMYFDSVSELTYFRDTADKTLRKAEYNAQYDEWLKQYPVTYYDELLQKINA